MATEAGLIGIGINSALSVVVPPGGMTPLLSTNPLTIGIPRPGQAPLILDMATSAGTFSQVMMAQRDHTSLPAGVAVDPEGHPTIDPFKAVDEANRPHLLPFGGYKGFGIELMIELLCDACLGTPSGKSKLRAGLDPTVDNGLYLALRPDMFVERDVFDAQVTQLIADLHDSSKAAGSSEVRLPGEESQHRKAALLKLTPSRLRNFYTSSYWPREHFFLTENTAVSWKCSPSGSAAAKAAMRTGRLVTRQGIW